MTKICSKCKESKPVQDFHKHPKTKDGLRPSCKICTLLITHNYYVNNKSKVLLRNKILRRKTTVNKQKKLLDYLGKHPCTDCGNSDIRVLEFDHVRGSKKLEVARAVSSNYSWQTVEKEIEKCEVVCRNCHAIREHKRANTYRIKYMRLLKCKNADNYKALRPPRCGCEACKQKWESINRAKSRKLERIRK